MVIRVVNEMLSDRSKVHDLVVVMSDGTVFRLPCIDQDCAIVLAEMLCDMVNDFTTETARRAF